MVLGLPNNWRRMDITDREIIELLGGPAAVARRVGCKTPSVSGWLSDGIPEGRLIELAAEIERRAPDRFSRRARWPLRCAEIWPDLGVGAADPDQPTPPQPHGVQHA